MDYSTIKNIVFDLGRVVVDIAPENAFNAFSKLSKTNCSPAHIEAKMAENNIWKSYESGEMTDQEFREWIRQSFDIEADNDIIDYSFNTILQEVDPQKVKLIQSLSAHYNLFVLSNTSKIHMDYFLKMMHEKHGIPHFWDCFTKPFLSYEMGCWKPEKSIYQKMLKVGNMVPAQTLFFDDLEVNVQAAEELGIQTIQILPDYSFVDFFIQNHSQFKFN